MEVTIHPKDKVLLAVVTEEKDAGVAGEEEEVVGEEQGGRGKLATIQMMNILTTIANVIWRSIRTKCR